MSFTLLTSLTEEEFDEKIKRCVKEALADQNAVVGKDDTDQILSINDAVKFLQIAKQTVYFHTSQHTLPHYKKGKKLYFKKSELEAWMLSSKQKTVDEMKSEYNAKRKI